MIEFYKYHGTGNDFIMIDNTSGQFSGDKIPFVQKWCNRRFGIGSDGMIFIENSSDEGVDFVMDFYNPDGSQSLCGNGSRCALAFAKELGLITDSATFMAYDGKHEGKVEGEEYWVHMSDVSQIERKGEDYFIDTGSPHYISYCDATDNRDIIEYGRSVRYSDEYRAEGTNVNLIKELGAESIDLRTYERGVENETFACGTGATAAALSFADKHELTQSTIAVAVKGGDLKVSFVNNQGVYQQVYLIGPAKFVFKGIIDA